MFACVQTRARLEVGSERGCSRQPFLFGAEAGKAGLLMLAETGPVGGQVRPTLVHPSS